MIKTMLRLLPFILLFNLWHLAGAEDLKELAKLNPLSGRAYLLKGNIVRPGEQVELRIELQLMEQFFAYGDKFSLFILAPEKADHGELFVEPLVEFTDVVSQKPKMGIRGAGTIHTQIVLPPTLTAAATSLSMDLKYIACTTKICLVPKILHLEVPLTLDPGVAGALAEPNSRVLQAINTNLPLALLLIFFLGLLTSFTPCVYPLIPITMAVLGTKQRRSTLASFGISLSYVVGIALTYALLGVIAAQTGQLFGSLMAHPAVIITMSGVFLAMGLSLFGLFTLEPPAIIRNRLANKDTGHGPLGAFIAGTLAGVVASPCVGPVLVTILTYIAKTQDSLIGFILLFSFAMGFGLLFIVLGTFTQLTHLLPRSGRWMNGVKYTLGLIMILMAGWYVQPLATKILGIEKKTATTQGSGVQWIVYQNGVIENALKGGRPIIVDFYADWCTACVEMDKFTFSVPAVINKSKQFTMVKVDGTETFAGLNELVQKYDVYGFPTMIFLNKKGEVIEELTLTGFENAEEFNKRMDSAIKQSQF